MTRWKAASIHLAASIALAVAAASLLLFVWFPPPLFSAAGGDRLVVLLVGIDIVIGPLLTLIVFRSGKPGMRFDLAVISTLQLAALAYGLHVISEARPAWLVFAVDRFVAVSAGSLEDADLQAAPPAFRHLSWTGPKLVGAKLPELGDEAMEQLESALKGKDIERDPRYYVDYETVRAAAVAHRRPLAVLAKRNEAAVAALVRAQGGDASKLGFLPLMARNRDLAVVIDDDGNVAGYIDADPW